MIFSNVNVFHIRSQFENEAAQRTDAVTFPSELHRGRLPLSRPPPTAAVSGEPSVFDLPECDYISPVREWLIGERKTE
jgi:hypothetical protein